MPAVALGVFVSTIFCSAFLLFLVQPLIAKQILPWFGGAAAVWTLCMVFFQSLLLAGYAYADFVVRRLPARRQALLHGGLLLVSLASLPIVASTRWRPAEQDDPTLLILGLLAATVGLPYFLLSSTGPLLQAWLARTDRAAGVYRCFALSNAASLLALLAYPLVVEPHLALRSQALGWSTGYALFVGLCTLSALFALRFAATRPVPAAAVHVADEAAAPPAATQALWLLLPAMGSWLLLAVTNHLTQKVASIPFLWVLPLVVYLLSFILCFDHDRWYRRGLFLPLAAAALACAAWSLHEGAVARVGVALPFFLGALFVLCMVLHGETALLRPPPAWLTRFYLMLSAGGALGGIAVGLVAPALLDGYHELGIGLALTALLGVLRWRSRRAAVAGCALLAAGCSTLVGMDLRDERAFVRRAERNFYGVLQSYDLAGATPAERIRVLRHGAVLHGEQFLDPARRREPTAYYGHSSGIGRLLAGLPPAPVRVGLVGLGAGTLATYGRAGDLYRLYEIDPQVFELARSEFTFLADSPARFEDVPGDARLAMEREAPQRYDVLVIDAFSGGAIPVHLITVEAVEVYLRHLQPGGVLAFHLTNRHLDLPPVLLAVARERGLAAAWVHDDAAGSDLRRTDWVLLSRDPTALRGFPDAVPLPARVAAQRPWTDDYNDLIGALK